jgi:HEAT repeat protein
LLFRLEDRNGYVRQNAAYALAHLGPLATEAIPALRKAVDDQNLGVRRAVRVALARMGQEVTSAVPDLIKGLQSPDRNVRHLCSVALRNVDSPEAKEALKTFHLD